MCSFLRILHTRKVFSFEGSTRALGSLHPWSSFHLHYSFFTDAERLEARPRSLPDHSHWSDVVVPYAITVCTYVHNFNVCHVHTDQSLHGFDRILAQVQNSEDGKVDVADFLHYCRPMIVIYITDHLHKQSCIAGHWVMPLTCRLTSFVHCPFSKFNSTYVLTQNLLRKGEASLMW